MYSISGLLKVVLQPIMASAAPGVADMKKWANRNLYLPTRIKTMVFAGLPVRLLCVTWDIARLRVIRKYLRWPLLNPIPGTIDFIRTIWLRAILEFTISILLMKIK